MHNFKHFSGVTICISQKTDFLILKIGEL